MLGRIVFFADCKDDFGGPVSAFLLVVAKTTSENLLLEHFNDFIGLIFRLRIGFLGLLRLSHLWLLNEFALLVANHLFFLFLIS